jgi:hypothetical protein
MTTINALGNGLKGVTGSGNFVGSNSATLIAPTLGAATGTSIAFNPTTNGIVGTAAANNATAGDVGELLTSSYTGVDLTSGPAQIVTLSLSAGDWQVWGAIRWSQYVLSTTTYLRVQLNTSAAFADPTTAQLSSIVSFANSTGSPQGANMYLNLGFSRWNVSGSTTVYMYGTATGSFSNVNTMNGIIFARRIR